MEAMPEVGSLIDTSRQPIPSQLSQVSQHQIGELVQSIDPENQLT